MTLQPRSIEEVQGIARERRRLAARGAGTKTGLFPPFSEATLVELRGLSGIVEYTPDEFTFTALAGTPVREVKETLAAHGQYFPFDPLFAERGATLGGTVAANSSGPGRVRYGGVRDFLLGVSYVDGSGRLLRGGGKVVKNAAGFDLPKLMVGSLGSYGILVELTFKVFPQPPHYATIRLDHPSLDAALSTLARLATSSLELHALELDPPGTVWLRAGGLEEAHAPRMARLTSIIAPEPVLVEDDAGFWREAREMRWIPRGALLVKVPLTPGRIPGVGERLQPLDPPRRYGAAGNVLWLAWLAPAEKLDHLLAELGLAGMALLGLSPRPLLGKTTDNAFARRVKAALDPEGKFGGG